jgi:hypothetical protein
MIVKCVARPKGTSSFARLGHYILDQAHGGEKVTLSRVTHCQSADAHWALREIEATQLLNTRSRTDKTCHLVVSFPAGESPTSEQLADIEEVLAKAIGLDGHQRISALHRNTDHVHLHVALNRIHPQTHRCVHVLRDYYRLDEACRLLEERHGLDQDNRIARAVRGGNSVPVGLPARATDLETQAGEQSFVAWLRELQPQIEAARDHAASWPEFHKALEALGLRIAQRGAGLVFLPTSGATAAKASQLSRAFSARALSARWGAFGPSTSSPALAATAYRRQPLQKNAAAGRLYESYLAQRAVAQKTRDELLERTRENAKSQREDIARWYAQARLTIRQARHLTRAEKKLAYSNLARERRAREGAVRSTAVAARNAARQPQAGATWLDYLRQAADTGDAQALEVLRARERKESNRERALLTAPTTTAARVVVMKGARAQTRKNGDVVYSLSDGSRVRDTAAGIHAGGGSLRSTFAALLLAEQRYSGQPLIVEGNADFRARVAELAGRHALRVAFQDPEIEKARLAQRQDPKIDVSRSGLQTDDRGSGKERE